MTDASKIRNFSVHGTIITHNCRSRPIRQSDVYNGEPNNSGEIRDGVRLMSRFHSLSSVTLKSDDCGELVKIYMYDDWNKDCQFITVGDGVTLEVSGALVDDLRANKSREGHSFSVALHPDEYGKPRNHIQVRLNSHLNPKRSYSFIGRFYVILVCRVVILLFSVTRFI